MSRAGREPAEDIKRRLSRACEEAGLNVSTARMYLNKHDAVRVVLVCASFPDWPHKRPLVTLLATVGTNGSWSGKVDVRCFAAEDESIRRFWDIPTLRGRSAVPLESLVDQLQETIEEWRQVVAAVKLGIPGPYPFKEARWERPAPITGPGQ